MRKTKLIGIFFGFSVTVVIVFMTWKKTEKETVDDITATITLVPTSTTTPTPIVVPTSTTTPTPIVVPTATTTPTPIVVPTATITPIPTVVPTATTIPTSAPSLTVTEAATITPELSVAPEPTATLVPTNTPIPTLTNTPVPTATPQPTNTPVPTPTETAVYYPAEDGYPVFVESWMYEGFFVEVWQVDKARYRTSVMVISGKGKVPMDVCMGWKTYSDYNRSVEKIYFSDGITEINGGLPTEGVKEVRFPVTVKVIGSSAFKNSKLIEVILPEGLERIERSAFAHCYDLEKVELPSTLTYIGRGAFAHKIQLSTDYENSLPEVIIPKSVEWIGYGAFQHRYNLVLILEKGVDISDYEEGWNYDGKDEPLGMITK